MSRAAAAAGCLFGLAALSVDSRVEGLVLPPARPLPGLRGDGACGARAALSCPRGLVRHCRGRRALGIPTRRAQGTMALGAPSSYSTVGKQAEARDDSRSGGGEYTEFPFKEHKHVGPFKVLFLYWDYVQWLWKASNASRDRDGLPEKVLGAIEEVEALAHQAGQGITESDMRDGFEDLLNASRALKPTAVKLVEASKAPPPPAAAAATTTSAGPEKKPRSTLSKRLRTGFAMGGVVTLWIFSGKWAFTVGFAMQSLLAQLEYYRMAMSRGHRPARRISVVSTMVLYLMATAVPSLHNYVMANVGCYIMLYFLLVRPTPGTISDISTTFMGIFYGAYLPSFWVRLRALGATTFVHAARSPSMHLQQALMAATEFAPAWVSRLVSPAWVDGFLVEAVTRGAILTWWTYMSIVAADVGAFVVGKLYGKNKLSTISASAGYASPNKTVEGVLGGLAACVASAMVGGRVLGWPMWYVTGALYGVMLCLVGLVGDLTASMFKRDAGFKDSGYLLPGHGGYLDRVDSYMFTAPPAYLFMTLVLPFFERLQGLLGT